MLSHKIFRLIGKCTTPLKFSLRNNPNSKYAFSAGVQTITTTTSRPYKMYVETENAYAFESLVSRGHMKVISLNADPVAITDDLESYLQQDWTKKSSQELCDAFGVLGKYCSEKNVCISNNMFDSFIDFLTDNVKHMTDEQLETMFLYLKMWPETESVKTRNFIEVWASLDDACLSRYKEWSIDKKLLFATLMYKLNISRSSEYAYKCTQKLIARANSLTPSQVLQTCFHLSVLRSKPLDKHNIELNVQRNLSSFTIDDLAILSMGFFKTKSPIRNKNLLMTIVERIINEKEEIDDIAFAALLKLVRYSVRSMTNPEVNDLLNAMESEIARLSVMACVHVGLLCSTVLVLHKPVLDRIAHRVAADISTARTKDLERLVMTFCVLYYHPPNLDFVSLALDELRKPERQDEIDKYGRSVACCVCFASFLNYYPYDLIDQILDPAFIAKTYGKHYVTVGREILSLDNTVEINCPDYTGNRLTEKMKIMLSKEKTDYVPDENFKCQYNIAENVMLNVMLVLRRLYGGKEFVCGDHALPQYQRGDIIICQDKNGNPVNISEHFPIKTFGLVKRAPTDDHWIAFIVAGRNAFLRNTGELTGPFKAKCRDLKMIGYHPAIINIFDWNQLSSPEEKTAHLQNLIKEAVKT